MNTIASLFKLIYYFPAARKHPLHAQVDQQGPQNKVTSAATLRFKPLFGH
ncbi:hypothetical protein HX776_05125 [Pseudomonas agarici]|nr:hypothetical protein [Pseudomonas agarici]NWC08216.1 hypothetical protein [Pseudomonas agarici]